MVASYTLLPLARPAVAGADQLSSAQAQAAQIQNEIATTGRQIDSLDQQYQAALERKASIDTQISATQAKVNQARSSVNSDQAALRKAAINAYISGGTSGTQGSLFSGDQNTTQVAREYTSVAEGNLGTAMANLHTSENQLAAQETTLKGQDAQAQAAVTAAQDAQQQAQTVQSQQQAALNQVNTQIAQIITQQRQAAAAAAQAAAQAQIKAAQAQAARQAAAAQATAAQAAANRGGTVNTVSAAPPPPPPSSGGAGTRAVAAAESQIGVPYVWGGESPGRGFDCSGLTAWAWGQAGVPLPHYSGAQMADSTPVPISDLQPGDLLFYGPGGATHVAMYVGNGQMIEAPYTGANVWITGVRLNTGNFAGAGRP